MDASSVKQRSAMQSLGTLQVTTPTDREIVMTRVFDAPRDVVFAAWTQAEHVRHWWDPSGRPLSVCEIDLRPDGAFRWIHRDDNREEYPFTGTYREIRPPERLVFSARTFPSSPESLATLVFQEQAGQTKLTITIACQSREDRDAMLAMRVDAGTAKTLENLAAYLPKIV